jgi:C-terminal peptidase prc
MQALLPVVRNADDALATAAAELLGDPAFKRGLDETAQTERLDTLLSGARNGSWTPERRLACAFAAHRTGGGTERRQARAEMLAFLDSSDANLRRLGALALGRIGEVVRGPLREELKQVAALPGTDGALAEAYLKQEEIKSLHERKFQNLLDSYTKKTLPADLAQLEAVMQLIENAHLDGALVDREQLVNAGANGMLHMLDQHSAFLGPEFYKRFQQELEAEYGGIGAYVDIDPTDGLFTITRPIYSGPAYQAGLSSDDKIVRIDDWPTLNEDREDIIKRLKGKPGTPVRLYVWRRGMDPNQIDRPTEDMIVDVARAQIEIPPLAEQLLPGGIGLIDLREFSRITSKELRQSIKRLTEQGMTALVLDLRRNSGGLLTEARNVADLFLPRDKRVVSTETRDAVIEEIDTRINPVIADDLPVIVLTGRFTASAAEIVSGALQDHERAVLVGQRTFGKGSVQTLIPLDGAKDDEWEDVNGNRRWDDWEPITQDWNGNGEFDYAPHVKLTVARYVLPSGRSIHRELDIEHNVISEGGIRPDVPVSQPRVESWRLEERYRIQRDRLAREYVSERWDEYRELFASLAVYDGKDTSRYPDFDEFMASLNTPLSRDDVRQCLRREVRRRVQDERGAEFPGFDFQGDFQEDVELQTAIRLALEDLGVSPDDIPEYESTFADPATADEGHDNLVAVLPNADDIASTRAVLERARASDGRLSKETLDYVLEILDDIGKN